MIKTILLVFTLSTVAMAEGNINKLHSCVTSIQNPDIKEIKAGVSGLYLEIDKLWDLYKRKVISWDAYLEISSLLEARIEALSYRSDAYYKTRYDECLRLYPIK